MEIDLTRKTVLILRTCREDMSSHDEFMWPVEGYVEAPDWAPTSECGNGLHGWLRGVGDASLGYWGENSRALVVETYADHLIGLRGKVKFPFGWVIFAGSLADAARKVMERHPNVACIGS